MPVLLATFDTWVIGRLLRRALNVALLRRANTRVRERVQLSNEMIDEGVA